MDSTLTESDSLPDKTSSEVSSVIPALGVKNAPTAEEWQRFRPQITDLYRGHTLNDVMQIMRDSHAFHAT